MVMTISKLTRGSESDTTNQSRQGGFGDLSARMDMEGRLYNQRLKRQTEPTRA